MDKLSLTRGANLCKVLVPQNRRVIREGTAIISGLYKNTPIYRSDRPEISLLIGRLLKSRFVLSLTIPRSPVSPSLALSVTTESHLQSIGDGKSYPRLSCRQSQTRLQDIRCQNQSYGTRSWGAKNGGLLFSLLRVVLSMVLLRTLTAIPQASFRSQSSL